MMWKVNILGYLKEIKSSVKLNRKTINVIFVDIFNLVVHYSFLHDFKGVLDHYSSSCSIWWFIPYLRIIQIFIIIPPSN